MKLLGNKVISRQRVIAILLGIVFSILALELGLRLGGFLFISFQEYDNRISLYKKGTYRIMCLGESTTACGGEDSYPSQLEEILNQRNIGLSFSVINKGIVATNTSHILAKLEENLNKYKPDMVVAMMGNNDGEVSYYRDIPEANTGVFRYCSAYRFIRLIYMHILKKLKEEGIYGLEDRVDSRGNHRSKKIETANERKFFSAEESFKKAIELGRHYELQGNHAQAIKAFRRAIHIKPLDDVAYMELGWTYGDTGKIAQGEELLKKAIALNPRNDIAYVGLGLFYQRSQRYKEVEGMFKKAIALNSRNDIAYTGLGWCYIKEGKLIQAGESFKKAIYISPENDKLYGGLATVYKEMGKDELAEEYYNKANKLRLEYYSRMTWHSYQKLKAILDQRGIKLVCAQYPVLSVEPLKKIFQGQKGVIFVDNERVFKEALKIASYKEYFRDMFSGDFGHCTPKGNRLLAENIANVIIKEVLSK